jgi:surface carbohydrate biosynthesis protein (TIGR04326 family)
VAASEILVLWDSPAAIDVRGDALVLWRSFRESESSSTYSLPELVENDARRLKSKYLNWVKEIGFTDCREGRLLDQIEIRPGFSYWWMTLIAEKSVGKSPCIYDVVKLFALEDLCKNLKPKKIIINTSNLVLQEIIENWCRSTSTEYETYSGRKKLPITTIYQSKIKFIAEIVKSTVRICRYYAQRSQLGGNSKKSSDFSSDITVVDYLIHLGRRSITDGQFRSNYWTCMVDTMRASKRSVNWLHHYVEHTEINTPRGAAFLLKNFNENSDNLEFHTCFDAGLSWAVLSRVIRDYLKLLRYAWILRDVGDYFRPRDSHLNLWQLYEKDWISSMVGSTAVWNCFTLNLLEVRLTRTKRQKLCIYLQENQGWESALIYVWKTCGHGKLVGVPHTTVRFWDLRYFHAPCLLKDSGKNALPRPDFVAVNSNVAKEAYTSGGYPRAELLDVEALRYLYLKHIKKRNVKDATVRAPGRTRILILGDIIPSVNDLVLKTVSDACQPLACSVTFYVRAHPACPINLANARVTDLKLSEGSLVEALQECDAVLTGAGTSASVDAYCMGIRVIQVLSPERFNMCPLRGLPGVNYVRSALKLQEIIDDLTISISDDRVEYFNLDEQIPAWRKMLEA